MAWLVFLNMWWRVVVVFLAGDEPLLSPLYPDPDERELVRELVREQMMTEVGGFLFFML